MDNKDPIVAASNVYRFLNENENARVLEVTFKPGDTAKMHHHPQHMAYVKKGGQLRLTSGGKTQEMNLTDGSVVFLDEQDHEATNTGNWRGIGTLDNSAYALKDSLSDLDARKKYNIKPTIGKDIHQGCQCHNVIVGKIKPAQCPLFLKACTPAKPVGACMVSSEGTCRVWAKNVATNAP